MFCFCNDSATTEFDTYRHTLSLHDALPIWRPVPGPGSAPLSFASQPKSVHSLGMSPHASSLVASGETLKPATSACVSVTCVAVRSEEHTSELQSLMRTSYAVFCLNKKTHIHRTNTQQQHDRNR